MCKVFMVRCIRFRSVYGVYVYDERGVGHHRPHAHIKHRGRRIASVFLETGTFFDQTEAVPADLRSEIESRQDELLDKWEELNT